MKKEVSLILLSILFWACKKETELTIKDYKPNFVVEGWIEDGSFPYVIITHNSPFFASLDSTQLDQLMIRHAKVTVSDGEQTEVLTAKRDTNYFPPFIYRGTEMIGKPGKTYSLKIEYAGYTLSAETTIPKPVSIDSLWFVSKDTIRSQLNIRFRDNALEKNYYRIYTKTPLEKHFVPTLVSNKDDKYFNGKQIEFQINRGPENNLVIKNVPYFMKKEIIQVKLSTIPESGFKFWSSFQDEVVNSSNPLVGSTGRIESNIKGQGIGIWCGYGSTVYQILVK